MSEPVLLAIISIVPGLILGYLGYRISKKKDVATEKLNIVTGSAQQVTQAFEALQLLVNALQAEKKADAEEIRVLTDQRDKLQREVIRMYRKYGNGDVT